LTDAEVSRVRDVLRAFAARTLVLALSLTPQAG
jgi:hypothetical protein